MKKKAIKKVVPQKKPKKRPKPVKTKEYTSWADNDIDRRLDRAGN